MQIVLIFLALIGFSLDCRADSLSDFAASREWHKLLHYEKKWLGGYESQVDGAPFFLSPQGKSDPLAELKETVRLFAEPLDKYPQDQVNDLKPIEDVMLLHPLCRFPARALLLERKLGLKFQKPNCYHYNDYVRALSARSVALVFSSFYLGSPSSTFGHTFLRVNSSRSQGQDGEHFELLDHGINYAAEVRTANPLLYALYGIIGGFRGTFTNVPYYYKVREYNDFEARDLWSYDLNLTPDELTLLVAHIWELGATYYDYYYFTENCSYHMFTTIEAAAPRLDLVERMPFYIIPSDTVRKLNEVPGLVSHITYRPSTRTQFEERRKRLTGDEQDLLEKLVLRRNEKALDGLDPAEKAKILDAALDLMEYRYPEDLLKEKSESAVYKQKLLVQRASLGIKSEELVIPPPDEYRPHVSHGVSRWTLRGGHEEKQGAYAGLALRWAMHDELDSGQGYPQNAQIEFMNWIGRYQFEKKNFEIDELTLFRVLALSPMTRFQKPTSYHVEVGVKKITDRNCNNPGGRCLGAHFEVAGGASLNPSERVPLTVFLLPELKLADSPVYEGSRFKIGGGARSGFIFHFNNEAIFEVMGVYRYMLFAKEHNDYEQKIGFRKSFQHKWALDFAYSRFARDPGAFDLSSAVMIYF